MQEGENITIDGTGLPLGLFCDSNFAASCVKLKTGDTILLYTDGVTEAVDSSEQEFGFDRLSATLKDAFQHDPAKLVRNCLASVEGFRGNAAKHDDLTIMALKFAG